MDLLNLAQRHKTVPFMFSPHFFIICTLFFSDSVLNHIHFTFFFIICSDTEEHWLLIMYVCILPCIYLAYYIVHAYTHRCMENYMCSHTYMYLHEHICLYTFISLNCTYIWVHTPPAAESHFCLDV